MKDADLKDLGDECRRIRERLSEARQATALASMRLAVLETDLAVLKQKMEEVDVRP